ncbi:ACT domain-containing protein [Alkalihalobacterium bogoriense]|uniref:ACT domain-containing protein n=1 Tax=Alkalihalobacterium bogoriense TaxID=246272 RepID=UPI00047B9AE4|nr:ACT domain-containing protein [Alkalihalobacterium bogoriense]
MSEELDKYYLVREDMLSEAMVKTLEAKAMLQSGKAKKISEAVHAVGISRSAFYKYKDGIFPFHSIVKEQIITLSIHLEDRAGALSQLLSVVAQSNANVLTINQTIPLKGSANITLSIDISPLTEAVSLFVQKINELDAVEKVEIIGSGV